MELRPNLKFDNLVRWLVVLVTFKKEFLDEEMPIVVPIQGTVLWASFVGTQF